MITPKLLHNSSNNKWCLNSNNWFINKWLFINRCTNSINQCSLNKWLCNNKWWVKELIIQIAHLKLVLPSLVHILLLECHRHLVCQDLKMINLILFNNNSLCHSCLLCLLCHLCILHKEELTCRISKIKTKRNEWFLLDFEILKIKIVKWL